jgi:hypothetical protein
MNCSDLCASDGDPDSASAPVIEIVDDPQTSSKPESSASERFQNGRRATQRVASVMNRKEIVKWMISAVEVLETEKGIISKAVREFPEVFRSHDFRSKKAAMMKASRWWRARSGIIADAATISRATSLGRKRHLVKVSSGRGRKRAQWVTALYDDLFDEFRTLQRMGCKLSTSVLRFVALDLLRKGREGVYGFGLPDPASRKSIETLGNCAWISRFQDFHGLHSRRQVGKLQLSPAKTEEMERTVAKHIGMLKRDFESGVLDENVVENGDETHFLINMDNGRTVAGIGDRDIRYTDVVSGGTGMTMFVRVSGGAKAQLQPAFMVFQSPGKYPIRGADDNNLTESGGKVGWTGTL